MRKDIIGFEDSYEIDERGFVYSKTRKTFLKTRINKEGYEIVALGGREKQLFRIDELMVKTFIRDLEEDETVNHINFNLKDSRLSNLEIVKKKKEESEFVVLKDYPDYELNKNGVLRKIETGLIISSYISGNSIYVRLLSEGNLCRVQLDKLVLETFMNQDSHKTYIIHKDCDLNNCKLENLEFVTKKEKNDFYRNKKLKGINKPHKTKYKKDISKVLIYVVFDRTDEYEHPLFYGTIADICKTYKCKPTNIYQAMFRIRKRKGNSNPIAASFGSGYNTCLEIAGLAKDILSKEELEIMEELGKYDEYSLLAVDKVLNSKYRK